MLTPLFLAEISGKAVVTTVGWVIVAGLVCGILWWLIDFCKLPEPFNRVAKVIVAVAAAFFLINLLFGLMGHPIFSW